MSSELLLAPSSTQSNRGLGLGLGLSNRTQLSRHEDDDDGVRLGLSLTFAQPQDERAYLQEMFESHRPATAAVFLVLAAVDMADLFVGAEVASGPTPAITGALEAVVVALALFMPFRPWLPAAVALLWSGVIAVILITLDSQHYNTTTALTIPFWFPMGLVVAAAPFRWALALVPVEMVAVHASAVAAPDAPINELLTDGDGSVTSYVVTTIMFSVVALLGSRYVELQTRRGFLQARRLREANLSLEVSADPFSLASVADWLLSREPAAPERSESTGGGGGALRPWEIDFGELQLDEVVAAGASGRVYRARMAGAAAPVAVKEIFTMCLGVEDLEMFARECGALARLHHPHILSLLGVSVSQERLYIVTELLPRSLAHALADPAADDMPPPAALARQLASGLRYMHANGVIHRDLKPQNVLVSDDWQLKICDFGLARTGAAPAGGGAAFLTSNAGTPQFMAPELFSGRASDLAGVHTDALALDVYSFGILLWCLLARDMPFGDLSYGQLALRVASEGLRPPVPEGEWPPRLVDLMRRCWDADPQRRPTFETVMASLGD